ncbi:hypothetical protein BE04_20965 [Sorangium cellulosum]|uniref:Uncharacterized protein n=1 Tax=Sorangium cellulosum TaxID=56 RepID=A0A150PR60_SORCE|nr:hypothetical protein BE04_20965 [Sorangium cellulosum]
MTPGLSVFTAQQPHSSRNRSRWPSSLKSARRAAPSTPSSVACSIQRMTPLAPSSTAAPAPVTATTSSSPSPSRSSTACSPRKSIEGVLQRVKPCGSESVTRPPEAMVRSISPSWFTSPANMLLDVSVPPRYDRQ